MKSLLSTIISAFASGALTWAATRLPDGVPSNSIQWSGFAMGAVLGGAIAVVHLYQPVPS